MKILLSGATGGIGSAIKESLKEHQLCFIERDGVYCHPQEFEWLILAQGMIDEMKPTETFDVNMLLSSHYTGLLMNHIKQGVIYISSTAGIKGNSKFPIYAASKAALNCYAQSMAKAHPELQFYSICPGPTDTKMWRSLNLEGKAQPPEEVARVVKLAMKGAFNSGDIIQVRDGQIWIA